MRLLVAVDAPDWDATPSRHIEQYRRNALSQVLRDIADRIQNAGGNDGTYTRDGFEAKFKIEMSRAAADAA
jgi:hypothetical protein